MEEGAVLIAAKDEKDSMQGRLNLLADKRGGEELWGPSGGVLGGKEKSSPSPARVFAETVGMGLLSKGENVVGLQQKKRVISSQATVLRRWGGEGGA